MVRKAVETQSKTRYRGIRSAVPFGGGPADPTCLTTERTVGREDENRSRKRPSLANAIQLMSFKYDVNHQRRNFLTPIRRRALGSYKLIN